MNKQQLTRLMIVLLIAFGLVSAYYVGDFISPNETYILTTFGLGILLYAAISLTVAVCWMLLKAIYNYIKTGKL